MSSGSPTRATGVPFSKRSTWFGMNSNIWAVMAVLIIPGETALIRMYGAYSNAADAVREDTLSKLDGDERTGAQIILKSLEEPLRQLSANAGLEGSVIVQSVRGAKPGWGINIETGELEDLLKSGIGDPTMVTRSALQNAASIAKNILTTEAIVAEMPEKDGGGMPGGGMPDMGGMM